MPGLRSLLPWNKKTKADVQAKTQTQRRYMDSLDVARHRQQRPRVFSFASFASLGAKDASCTQLAEPRVASDMIVNHAGTPRITSEDLDATIECPEVDAEFEVAPGKELLEKLRIAALESTGPAQFAPDPCDMVDADFAVLPPAGLLERLSKEAQRRGHTGAHVCYKNALYLPEALERIVSPGQTHSAADLLVSHLR